MHMHMVALLKLHVSIHMHLCKYTYVNSRQHSGYNDAMNNYEQLVSGFNQEGVQKGKVHSHGPTNQSQTNRANS